MITQQLYRVVVLLFISCSLFARHHKKPPVIQKTPLYWDWSRIPTSRLEFPEHFLWGASTSAHQIEGVAS